MFGRFYIGVEANTNRQENRDDIMSIMTTKRPILLPNSPFDALIDFNSASFWKKQSKGRIQARYISPFAIILHQQGIYPKIGKGTWIGHFCIIDGSQGLEIGENCEVSCGVHIYTHSTASRCTKGKEKKVAPVKIGNNVFIGPNSIISRGCVIEDQTAVSALTFVPPYTIFQAILREVSE